MLRQYFLTKLHELYDIYHCVAILGPRQCGKTTLARQYAEEAHSSTPVHYFDLEDPNTLALFDTPKILLESLTGLIIIDEIQRKPELFPLLRVLLDKPNNNQYYLILGSASPYLISQSSESLAGRIHYLELTPFSYTEANNQDELWLRGGFPRSYLMPHDEQSMTWRKDYIRTFLEIDVLRMGINISPIHLHRLWMMLAHYHGNYINYSEIGRSLGLSHTTIRHYADILAGTFMLRQLNPWYENISKRQIKSPKIYIADSGILHALLDIHNRLQLIGHPKVGASWEGFVIEEIIRASKIDRNEGYFWGVQGSYELDFLMTKNNKKIGIECKYSDTPQITRSMHKAVKDLQLDELFIIHPGNGLYQVHDNIYTCGFKDYMDKIKP